MRPKKLGIEFKIFEYKGNQRVSILDYKAAPNNLDIGLKLIKDKVQQQNINLKSKIRDLNKPFRR